MIRSLRWWTWACVALSGLLQMGIGFAIVLLPSRAAEYLGMGKLVEQSHYWPMIHWLLLLLAARCIALSFGMGYALFSFDASISWMIGMGIVQSIDAIATWSLFCAGSLNSIDIRTVLILSPILGFSLVVFPVLLTKARRRREQV